MPVEALTNKTTQESSLYRPSPMSKMQQNLSELYEKTSSFVKERFNELHNLENPENASRLNEVSRSETQESAARLNPQGMGRFIDIYV
ncbi:MAG: hypothetical protein JXR73_04850 [Candidatus Omnitrophica bacterium]|nr:hypothetical protein [Candidatus Omnitrophota bacterium]